MTAVTRFAPSPTGRLHVGHAYSALFAEQQGDRFLLRIEDIDPTRCKPEFEQGIYEDLAWLGLSWETPVRSQSDHMDDYAAALDQLEQQHLLYPCFCTRKDITDEIARAGVAPHGPEGHLYPGICRALSPAQREDKIASGAAYALRLDMDKARAIAGPLRWRDRGKGWQDATPEILGNVVLARKEMKTSYHLSVTVDDDLQGITLVTRSEDLFYATHLHRLLQALLNLDVPEWHHHKILQDVDGVRLAKRNNAVTLQHFRETGKTPEDIRKMAGFT